MADKSPYDHLFDWLFPDPRLAEIKYQQLRQSLRLMIRHRLGIVCPHCRQTEEEIADVVIDRLVGRFHPVRAVGQAVKKQQDACLPHHAADSGPSE